MDGENKSLNTELDEDNKGEATIEMETSEDTSNVCELSIFDEGSCAEGSTSNVDVVMNEDVAIGGELQQDADDSDVDSDNEEEDEEEDIGEHTGQSKTVSDSVFGAFSFTGEGAKNGENTECVKSLEVESERWVGRDVNNTAVVNTQKQFVCVKFPAVIQNKDKALACLGGVSNILQSRKIGRIDLVFRPDDPYSKPVIGLYKENNHLLVKCRRRRKVNNINQPSTSASSRGDEMDDGYEYKVEVIGVVGGIFSFERPCDFQYLPVAKNTKSGGYQELLSDLLIQFKDERQEFINRDVPLYLPPVIFSRSEKPAKYVFQNDQKTEEKHIGVSRKIRHKGTQRVTFASEEVPQVPHPDAVALYETTKCNLDPLKKLFEERPLWSRVGIESRLRAINQELLRKHLTMVAYSFHTGPWLHLWCRFGYDPRKHKEAKMYQTIDFRIRKYYNREKVTPKKRGRFPLGRQGMNTVKGHRLPTMGEMANRDGAVSSGGDGASSTKGVDINYQFCPTQMPPYRQMYYQVCDVMHDEVQRLAHQNDGKEAVCTERDGWCIPDFLSLCRDILAEHAENLLWTSPDLGANLSKVEEEEEEEDVT